MKESQRWILSSLVTMIWKMRNMSPSYRLALNCTVAPEHLANVEVEQRDAIKRVRYSCNWRHSSCRTIQELSKLFPCVCLRPCNCMSCMFDIQKNTWHFQGAPDKYEPGFLDDGDSLSLHHIRRGKWCHDSEMLQFREVLHWWDKEAKLRGNKRETQIID